MPRARPSITTRSSISVRGYIVTPPPATSFSSAWYAPSSSCWPVWPAGVEGARHLRAAEGAVGQEPAVLARERHALRHALVDDLDADLGQPVDVGLAGAEVAALHRVVEQPVDAVAVVPVVLGRVDPALRRDRVRPPGRVLEAEALHVVAELAQGGRRGPAGQAAADDEDGELPLVGGVHQLHLEAVVVPLLLDGTDRESSTSAPCGSPRGSPRYTPRALPPHGRITPAYTASGITVNPAQTITASTSASWPAERVRRRLAHAQAPAAAPDPVVQVQADRDHARARRTAPPRGLSKPVATLWYGSPSTKAGCTVPRVKWRMW